MIAPPRRVMNRVLTNIEIVNDCVLSKYSTSTHGYAQIGWNDSGKRFLDLCHRVSWFTVHGPIPEDMTIDHICKNRKCINVKHLRLLSNFENARRTFGRDWPVGECAQGHPNSELRMNAGRLRCRICSNEKNRKKRARQKLEKSK